jgi:hypothetical protein
MPRYFFHVRGGPVEAEDEEGSELPDATAAERYAIVAARELLAAAVIEGRLPLDERIDINDASGRRLQSLSFGEAVGAPR